jgi:yeast amino acid transporter
MSFTYLRFRKALAVQGISRDSLPYRGRFQPFAAYYALVGTTIMAFVSGYPVFLPGRWSVPTFLFSYTMIGLFFLVLIGWKIAKKTKWLRPEDVDLVGGVAEIEAYTRGQVPRPPR